MGKFGAIETKRLQIRILEIKDKESMYKYRSLPEIFKYQTFRPKDIIDIENFINTKIATFPNIPDTWMQLAVCLPTGELIGDLGIHFLLDDLQVEIGYTISPMYQGKGYATEASIAVINYLFFNLLKNRVTASVDPNNIKSTRLLEKLGFKKEAHLIKSYHIDGNWFDDCIYSVSRDEWKY